MTHGVVFGGDLDPTQLLSIFNSVIRGDVRTAAAVYERIIARDAHIRAESEKRFDAHDGLTPEIIPATPLDEEDEDFDEDLAREVCGYVRRVVRKIEGWDKALTHIVEARGYGAAVVELEWGTDRDLGKVPLVAHCIPFASLRYDSNDPWRLRVTNDDDYNGFAIDEALPGQFIFHAPKVVGGNAFVGGLYYASLFWYALKTWDIKYLMRALQTFGTPTRIAKYPDGSAQSVIDALLNMLDSMGQNAYGVFPEGTTFEAIAAGLSNSQAEWPQERLIALFNKELTKLWSYSTLTTEVSDSGGNRALGEVHERQGLIGRDKDLRGEGCTVTGQFIRPVVLYKFGEAGLRVLPTFRRVIEKTKDLGATATLIGTLVNEAGAPIPMRVVPEELGFPLVEGTDLDAPLPGRKGASPVGLPFGASTISNREGAAGCTCDACNSRTLLRANADKEMEKILARRPISSIGTWLAAAVLASQSHTLLAAERFADALATGESKIMRASDGDLDDVIAGVMLPAFESLPHADLAELNRQSFLAARLHGQLVARLRVRDRLPSEEAELAANAERIEFDNLPFVEAIESLRDRIGMTPDEFIKLDAEGRSRAWRVAGVWDMNLLAVLHTNLLQTIKNGETARDFRLRVMPQMYEQKGWAGERPWHAQLVYDTNFSLAHAAGRFRQYDEFEINLWRFIYAAKGNCPLCRPLDGKVFSTKDTKYLPLVHWGCTCYEEAVFEEVFNPRHISQSDDVSHPELDKVRAQESALKFNVREYAALDPLNLTRFPTQYHEAFKKLAEARNWQVAA